MEAGIGAEGPRAAPAQQEQEIPASPAAVSAPAPANARLPLYPRAAIPAAGESLSGIASGGGGADICDPQRRAGAAGGTPEHGRCPRPWQGALGRDSGLPTARPGCGAASPA